MKTLPNIGLEEIKGFSIDDAMQFKNKFLCYEITEKGFDITFFINPCQSFTKHKATATKKVKELYSKGLLPAFSTVTLIEVDHDLRNLVVYRYTGA